MVKTIKAQGAIGGHFHLEKSWGNMFWKQEVIETLLTLPGVELRKDSMCQFGLRGGQGLPLRKDTGWCCDLPDVHEECLGTNARRGQIYTRAVVRGLCSALHACGDERFCAGDHDVTQSLTTSATSTIAGQEAWQARWQSTTAQASDVRKIWWTSLETKLRGFQF